jgi:hypothetical protein
MMAPAIGLVAFAQVEPPEVAAQGPKRDTEGPNCDNRVAGVLPQYFGRPNRSDDWVWPETRSLLSRR